MSRIVSTVGLALAVSLPALASSFHYGAVKFQPTDSIAFNLDSGDPGKPLTIVAMTDFKIDRADVLAAIDPASSLVQQAGNGPGNVVFVRLPTPGKCGIAGYLGKNASQFDMGDNFAARSTAGAAGRVAGNCATTTPGKIFDDAYDFNLSYDAPITDIPKPVRLPAGGGEPGAAYSALVKALQTQSWDVASAHVEAASIGLGKPKTAADMKEWFHSIGLNYPKQAAISGGQMKGDRALLEFTGKDREDKKIKGVVAMKKADGKWRVLDQSMYFTE